MRKLSSVVLGAALFASMMMGSANAQTLSLSFAGDCTLGCGVNWKTPATFLDVVAEQGYAYPLSKVRELFESDDLTMVNLECVLQDDASGMRGNRKHNFRGPTAYTEILRLGSVEAVNLGNNHTGDFGERGLASTKAALTAANIDFCLDEQVCFLEKSGVRIAFLGFNSDHYSARKARLADTIASLRAQGCQAVVVSIHGGTEYNGSHNGVQRNFAHHAIDSGADLVIGHHPHVLQGMEVYKQRTILYSLGDFAYGGNRRPRAGEYPSVVARVELDFDQAGYKAQTVTLYPAQISSTRPYNNYQPYLSTGEQAQETMRRIQSDTAFPLQPFVEGQGARQETVFARDVDAR